MLLILVVGRPPLDLEIGMCVLGPLAISGNRNGETSTSSSRSSRTHHRNRATIGARNRISNNDGRSGRSNHTNLGGAPPQLLPSRLLLH